jgi:hypothetical protein
MRRILLTAAIACGMCVVSYSARAADKEVKGVLIDNNCGSKQLSKANPEEAAEGHPKSCAMKEGCAASGFAVISGKKLIKLDDAGNEKAKAYLKEDTNATRVVVMGTLSDDGKTIKVSEIKADKSSKDKKKES